MLINNKLQHLEIVLVSLLLIALPSTETFKIIFWALYLLMFIFRRYLEHGFSFKKPDTISLSVIMLFLISLASTLVNWPIESGLSGAIYSLSYASLFLCIYHGGYTTKQIKTVIYFIIIGTLFTLLLGVYEYSNNLSDSLQLHSVGATTHSSIYMGIVVVVASGLLLDAKKMPKAWSILIYISLFFLTTGLFYMGSRGALLATLISLLIILILNHSLRVIVLSSSLAIIVSITSIILINAYPTNMNKPEYRERFSTERLKISDNERIENWSIAIAQLSTGDGLIWGIGPHNYQSINPNDLGIDSSFYKRTGELSHAHNLFLTQIVEQGIIGLAALLLFFYFVFIRLKNSWSYCKNGDKQWIWAAGLGALMLPVIAGLFNTPFYREHAMLAMIILGALYSETRKVAPSTHNQGNSN